MPEAGSPIGEEILQRIAALYAIEKQIRGSSPAQRRAVRQEHAKPLIVDLGAFIATQRQRLSPKSKMGEALAYLANHWEGLCLYLDDGRIEMDNNPVENLIRPLDSEQKELAFRRPRRGRPKLGPPGFAHRYVQAQRRRTVRLYKGNARGTCRRPCQFRNRSAAAVEF